MAWAQTATCKCTKCFWRRTATFGDASPALPRYERCPLCGSPTTSTHGLATPLDHAFAALLKLTGKKTPEKRFLQPFHQPH